MPMTFPSHQGLIAGLWRRWPGVFDVRALCIGAAMPDVIDAMGVFVRGRFGQGIGHSLVSLPLLCVPVGLLLWGALHRVFRRLPAMEGASLAAHAWNPLRAAMAAGNGVGDLRGCWRQVLLCLAIGAFSHLLIDLVSHGGFPWLLPWMPKRNLFPDWWYVEWARIPVPWRPAGSKLGPPRAVWILLSAWGAWVLIRPSVLAWRAAAGRRSSDP